MSDQSKYFYPQLADVAWLTEMHQEKGMDFVQIARLVGCTPAGSRTALVRYGIYRPKRRCETRVLASIDAEQMLDDASTVSSWWMLGRTYGVARIVVQDHAIVLGIFDRVVERFCPRPGRQILAAHPLLQSPSWIATTWSSDYLLPTVAKAAGGVSMHVLRRWMRMHRLTVSELRNARDQAIVVDYNQGLRLGDLVNKYGLDQGGLWRTLHAAGIDTTRWKHRERIKRHEGLLVSSPERPI